MIKRIMQSEKAMYIGVISCILAIVGVVIAVLIVANSRPDYTGPVRVADLSHTPAYVQTTIVGNTITSTYIPDSHSVLLCPTNGEKCWRDYVNESYWSSLDEGQTLKVVKGHISN